MSEKIVNIGGDGVIDVLNVPAPQNGIRISQREYEVIVALGKHPVEVVKEDHDPISESDALAEVLGTQAAEYAELAAIDQEAEAEAPEQDADTEQAADAGAEQGSQEPPPAAPAAQDAAPPAAEWVAPTNEAGVVLTEDAVKAITSKKQAVQVSEEFKLDLGWPEGFNPHDTEDLKQFKLDDIKGVMLDLLVPPVAAA